jgi:hypothetical protein
MHTKVQFANKCMYFKNIVCLSKDTCTRRYYSSISTVKIKIFGEMRRRMKTDDSIATMNVCTDKDKNN